MARSFGTFGRESAPVELIIIFSSNGRPGKLVGSLPVAIIVFFAVIVSLPPLEPFTCLHKQ